MLRRVAPIVLCQEQPAGVVMGRPEIRFAGKNLRIEPRYQEAELLVVTIGGRTSSGGTCDPAERLRRPNLGRVVKRDEPAADLLGLVRSAGDVPYSSTHQQRAATCSGAAG